MSAGVSALITVLSVSDSSEISDFNTLEFVLFLSLVLFFIKSFCDFIEVLAKFFLFVFRFFKCKLK